MSHQSKIFKWILLGSSSSLLVACMSDKHLTERYDRAYIDYSFFSSQIYSENAYSSYQETSPQVQPRVVVPDTYHVNAIQRPVSFKDSDTQWLRSQNPSNYTIELAHDEKASHVAQKLFKAPKSDRMAQIKCKNGYKGLYGSYDSSDAAKKALNALPPEVKSEAHIKGFASIQSDAED